MRKLLFILSVLTLSFLTVSPAQGASSSLYLAPSQGTFFVGSTFSVSIYTNTKGAEINAIEVDLRFPPDILQVTSPTAGESFISEWLAPPSYSNTGGTISFKGGIPGGVVTSAGLISTITFRAKSPGLAEVEFLDSSRVLLNDGKGTPIFTKNIGGVYQILVPPPEGPKITSPTHPDSDIWYSNSSPTFSWEKEKGVTDFSFSFSQNSQENPDIVPEGDATLKSYDNVPDGIWYFHLRARKNGIWGRTSHFAVKIDTTPPQEFEPRIETHPFFVYFGTRDRYSGIDHYEISMLNLNETPTAAPFFVEATSPFRIPFKEPGKYSIIIRAYDRAGNYQEAEVRFQNLFSNFSYIEGKGIQVQGILFPWWGTSLVLLIFVGGFVGGVGYFVRKKFSRKAKVKEGVKKIKEALTEIKEIDAEERETQRLREKFKKEKEKLEEKLK